MARPPIEVVILGTSSAVPTLHRGLSGTVLLREGETVLFDCGEGTQFRLLQAGIPRRKFHHIFITHLHGDHIFGLGGLISSLNLAQREYPLHLWGPRGLERYVRFVTSFPRPTRLGFPLEVHEFPPGYVGEVCAGPEWVVTSRPMEHSIPAMGYRFQERDLPGFFDAERADELGVPFGPERGRLLRGETLELDGGTVVRPEDVVGAPRPGRSVVYCTDTAYTVQSERLADDADLLIHEATYGDDAAAMARKRKHSTIRQAATVAKNAAVRRFVATHFSTRYDGPLLRTLRQQGREVFPDLVMAKDLMRLEVHDLNGTRDAGE